MRFSALLVGGAAFVAFAGPADVNWAFGDDGATCSQMSGDLAVAACTRVIQNRAASASSRADAYVNRGIEYRNKGQYDQAIADETEAIKLDPKRAHRLQQSGHRVWR